MVQSFFTHGHRSKELNPTLLLLSPEVIIQLVLTTTSQLVYVISLIES